MKHITQFSDFLTESNSINEGAKKISIEGKDFTVSVINDTQGLGLQFLASSKTLNKYSPNELVNDIQKVLTQNMPNTFSYRINSKAAGFVFIMDTDKLLNLVLKNI